MAQASVSKTWNAGEVLNADDLNQNFTDVVNGVNDVDNDNVSATAAILPTKLDDASSSAANHQATADPYASQTEQLPTDLQGELRQIRYQLQQLSRGTYWFRDIAYPHARNLLRNGSFDLWTDATANPEQWVDTATAPQTVTRADAQNSATNPEGDGYELQLTGEAVTANTGLQQTISGLRASTAYILAARVRISTGTAGLRTTGATTNVDITTTATDMTTLMAEFTTDATGTDVVVQVLATGAGDAVIFDHVACFCADMEKVTQPQRQVFQRRATAVGTNITSAGRVTWDDGTDDLDATIKVPGPGYYVKVDVQLGFEQSNAATCSFFLVDSQGGGTDRDFVLFESPNTTHEAQVRLGWVDVNPTVDTAITYSVEGQTSGGTVTPQHASAGDSWIRVEVIPYG